MLLKVKNVEDDGWMSLQNEKECLEKTLAWINENVHFDGAKFWMEFIDKRKEYPHIIGTEMEWSLYQRWEIHIENMTHVQREQLVKMLQDANLMFDSLPFYVYS